MGYAECRARKPLPSRYSGNIPRPALCSQPSPALVCMSLLIIVSACRPRAHLFEARLADRVLCVSRRPLLDAARILLAEGCDPAVTIVMRHAGSEVYALSARLGAAAKLTVDEVVPTFAPGEPCRRWRVHRGLTRPAWPRRSEFHVERLLCTPAGAFLS
jgi:hypothetical protein